MRAALNVRSFLVTILVASIPAFAAHGEEPRYLYDALKEPAYKAAWNRLLKGEQVPAWLTAFGRGGNGVSTPSKSVDIAGEAYELDYVCKPHDCAGNGFAVLFAPGARHAFGGLVDKDRPPRFFGAPDPAQKQALGTALKQ